MSTANASCLDTSGDVHLKLLSRSQPPLFTEEDESNLLNCYYQITTSTNSTNNSLDSPTLDLIETSLGLKFSPNQIVDRLRRLKLKYHSLARTKSLIRTPHDSQIYRIGRNLWGKGSSTTHFANRNEIAKTTGEVSGTRKEEVDLEKFPFLVSEFSGRFPGNVVWMEGMKSMEESSLMRMNEEWILLHSQQAELQAWRAALVHRQVRAAKEAMLSSQITDFPTI